MRAALLIALALLAGCGRVGPPRPPGPAAEIVWPRPYPARPAGQAAAAGAPQPQAPIAIPLPMAR